MNIFITYFVVFIAAAYITLIIYLTRGWKKIPATDSVNYKGKSPAVSVIIALHNEEKNAAPLLESLKKQTFRNFELVLVDDYSTDKTLNILYKNIARFANAKIISLTSQSGKKRAVSEGIKQSTGELIITTDADCTHTERWIESMVAYHIQCKADLISAPVVMKGKGNLLDDIQEIEFMSLSASGAGAIGARKPIMCNAANMAFTRTAWESSKNDLHIETASGDDVFLLLSIKKWSGKICFLKNSDAIVHTQTKENLMVFLRQRVRWSSKAKYYSDKDIIVTALLIFGICFSQIALLSLSAFNPYFFMLFTGLSFVKFITDFAFLSLVNQFYSIENLFIKSFLLSLIYPYYIVISALISFFKQKNRW